MDKKKSGFVAMRPGEIIPQACLDLGFNFGHTLYSNSQFEVVHFAFEFYGFKQYHNHELQCSHDPPSLAMSSPNAPGPTSESNARDIAALTQALDMVVSQFVRPAVQQTNANRETFDRVIDLLERHAEGLLSLEQRIDQLTGSLESVRDIVAQNAQQIAATVQQQQVNAQQIAQNAQQIATTVQQQQANAQQIAQNAQQIATTVQQQQANAQQIAQNAQQIAATVQQQQANAQQIVQNAEAITAFDQRLEETRQLVAKNSSDFARMTTETKANIDRLVEENRAFREESRAFRESQQSQLAAIIGNARRIDRLEQQAG